MGSISELCDQAIWMHRGELRMWDEPDAVIEAYTQFLDVKDDAVTREDVKVCRVPSQPGGSVPTGAAAAGGFGTGSSKPRSAKTRQVRSRRSGGRPAGRHLREVLLVEAPRVAGRRGTTSSGRADPLFSIVPTDPGLPPSQ